ncbi:MAG: glucose 1-dehydrogenase [Betaproteobacteria bacterium]|nr:glucose 1-dehydrogenase [Betaproteobacteria bacterium]
MRLKDKVALITGAAHGMGECIAGLFCREGAKVVIADVLEAEGKKVAADIVAGGGDCAFRRLDISDEQQWQEVMRAVVARHGRLNILVNNAGISGALPDRLSTEHFDRLMTVNARGTFLGVKTAIPELKKAGGGSIVNVSSISGLIGQPFVHMGYNAAKAAIHILTKSTAVQFGPDGIRCNSVHPGIMPPMKTSVTSADPALREKLIESIPLRRAGRSDEIAPAVLFLASDESSYITGTEIVVDGGFLAM